MDCLTNVIKLSKTTCECFDDDKPEEFNEGLSDITLDQLEGFPFLSAIKASANCEAGGLWDMMAGARTEAEMQFKADLMACVQSNLTMRRNNFKGIIGDIAFNSTLSLTEDQAGIAFKPYPIDGGYYVVERIGLAFNTTQPITVKVYSSEDTTVEIASYDMATAANNLQWVALSPALKLPLWSTRTTQLEYYFVYELTGVYLPKNIRIDCGCGKTSDTSWKNWGSIKGIKGADATDYPNYTGTKELNGLLLDVKFVCEATRLICSDEFPLDFENDGRAMQMAYAIRFKAAEIVVQKVLDSDEINRYTLMKREALYGKREHFRKKYEDWVAYLCENTEVTNTDCLMCKTNNQVAKGTILS